MLRKGAYRPSSIKNDVLIVGGPIDPLTVTRFERIDLAITSLLANQLVARDQCLSVAVTQPVNLSLSFLSRVSRHLI